MGEPMQALILHSLWGFQGSLQEAIHQARHSGFDGDTGSPGEQRAAEVGGTGRSDPRDDPDHDDRDRCGAAQPHSPLAHGG